MTREGRLKVVAGHGDEPHEFLPERGPRTFFGLPACVVCGKSALYVAHDADLRDVPSAGSSGRMDDSGPDRLG